MKLSLFIIIMVGRMLADVANAQDKPFRPATAIIPPEDYNTIGPEIMAAELAIPPIGEIQKIHLRVVNDSRSELTAILAAAPTGPDGQGSPWFGKAQTFKTGLDNVAASRLQSDCFALIPQIHELLKARGHVVPDFASNASGIASGVSTALINAIERHIIDNNATVSSTNLNTFIKVFSIGGFRTESDWEASPIPVDSAGIMILDAAAVITQLKTLQWQEADRFLGNASTTEAFARYSASGNGMAVLKTKYAANQTTIRAKWDELAAWVAAQRPPD